LAARGREGELRWWARRWVAAFAGLLLTWAEAERGGEGAGPLAGQLGPSVGSV